MKTSLFELRAYKYYPCAAEIFTIKGKEADICNFGYYEHGDYDDCSDEDILQWGCFKRYFKGLPYSENIKVAKKYKLTKEEYDEVASGLESVFAIGTCGWCV